MTEQAEQGVDLDLDLDAVDGLAGQLMRKVELHLRLRAAAGEDDRAGFEALNAMALVAGQLIAQLTGPEGQAFFEAVLLAQIRHLLRGRLGLAEDALGEPEGEA